MQYAPLTSFNPALAEGAELRAEPRSRVFLQATYFPVELDVSGTTVNVSRSGLMIDSERPIALGRHVHVSFDDAVFHRFQVARCDGARLGLRADNPLEVLGAITMLEHGENIGELPRAVRVGFVTAVRLLATGQPRPVKVRNLSTRGMMIESPEALTVHQPLIVQIGNGEAMEAHVRWSSNGRSGIRTRHPIEIR